MDDDFKVWTGKLKHVISKSGTSARGAWTLWTIICHDDSMFSTFTGSVAEDAEEFAKSAEEVDIQYRTNAKGFNNVVTITPKVAG